MSGGKGDSFAAMFARGDVPIAKARRLKLGDEVEGVIGHVGPDSVFVDLDDKQQAFFETVDLHDHDGNVAVKAGDRIKGWVVDLTADQIKLAKRFGRESSRDGGREGGAKQNNERYRTAFDAKMPIEGKVTAINKGGAEVDLGGSRGFCPMSQLDDRFVSDPTTFVGRSLSFVITKLDDRDIVLSRRQLLEREARVGRDKLLETLAVGAIVKGRVTQIREFGAFVDIGGIDGLIPSRELSHDRAKPEDVVTMGDLVEVQVKGIEKKGAKIEITLSLKALAGDPWGAIEALAPVGRVIAGQISKLAEFGAFVRLAPGIEGLLHVSELGARVKRPEDTLEIGQSVLVRVVSVEAARHRIALALASEGAAAGTEDRPAAVVLGSLVQATVEKVENFGLLVQIGGTKGRGGRALVPSSETNTKQGTDLRREFPIGKEITAKVIEVSDKRVRLSMRAAIDDAERADFDTFRSKQGGAGMGTLGDILKKRLKGEK